MSSKRKIKQDTKEERFYKAAKENNKSVLNSNDYILKGAFNIALPGNENWLHWLYEFVFSYENMCIAGGYPTLYHLEKDPTDFPNSDVDVYIMNNHKDTLDNLLIFLNRVYGIKEIRSYTDDETSVVNIECKKLHRTIQVIGVECSTVAELLNSFDASYCKCAYYMGNSYATYDAQYTKSTNTAIFYHNNPKISRLNKAHSLGLTIYGRPNYKPVVIAQSDKMKVIRTHRGIVKNFVGVKDWATSYTDSKDQSSCELYLTATQFDNIPFEMNVRQYSSCKKTFARYTCLYKHNLLTKTVQQQLFITTDDISTKNFKCITSFDRKHIVIDLLKQHKLMKMFKMIDEYVENEIPKKITKEEPEYKLENFITPLVRTPDSDDYEIFTKFVLFRNPNKNVSVTADNETFTVSFLDELNDYCKKYKFARFQLYLAPLWLSQNHNTKRWNYGLNLRCNSIDLFD